MTPMTINGEEPSPLHDLTAFKRDLLVVIEELEDDDPNGLKIKEHLEEVYGKDVHHGTLYPNLDDLVDMGLVVKGEKDKRTNWYSLSQRGQRELNEHRKWMCDDFEDSQENGR